MKLAWNAILRNEEARIERCVKSLLPYIDYAIVVDTGSEDRTPEKLSRLFAVARKPFEIYYAPFENFSQARNEALRKARASAFDWDYLIFADADMEFKVERPDWFNGGRDPSYDLRQVANGMSYYNRRLLSRQATGEYKGVTHEFLDVGAAGRLDGAWFVDHADGANRLGKLDRDINLLEQALKTETNPGLIQRYFFYLAQSFFDLGQWEKAADHYKLRVGMGGWDEECWYAQLRYAHCLGNMGDSAGFTWNMLVAHEMRPQRAETLYDLAKFFRERGGANFRSLVFVEAGSSLPRPADSLFVADHVYTSGLREEFAICAYYDERRRKRGAKECNRLALAGSEQARSNLYWYLSPLSEQVPSFKPTRIMFEPPDGYVVMNPSVINQNGQPLALVRTVNYAITPDGRYVSRTGDVAADGCPIICTRNWLVPVFVDGGLAVELEPPENWPTPQYPLVLGFEDSRLFEWRGQLYTLSTVRELTHEGWCEQVLSPLHHESGRWMYGSNLQRILPKHRAHEKNWMPWIHGDDLCFVYRLGTLVNLQGEVLFQHKPDHAVDHISGGSQVVKIDERTHLAIVHEARTIPGRPNRYYQHRFVAFWPDGRVDRISPPFFFFDRQIEFCAGLAHFPEKKQLMVSYGVRDEEAWTATMDVDQVFTFIYQQ
jgi:glycosyltransferase involved in cell wall biosynthesis